MRPVGPFTSEADLVAAFCMGVERHNDNPNLGPRPKWTAYHETAGWDLLLVATTGAQIGIEAKRVLNAKVLSQAIPSYAAEGPDFRAVLVPSDGRHADIKTLANALGLTVITAQSYTGTDGVEVHYFNPELPDEASKYGRDQWHPWYPAERCVLPDYIPDVMGGKAAPVALTPWKINAIKLVILLDRVGVVTRRDMRALGVAEGRWTAASYGFLSPRDGGYVRNERTPDFRTQHPVNYAQIEADWEKWGAGMLAGRVVPMAGLFEGAA